MKIIIETNIPNIIVDVWNGYGKWVIENLRGPIMVIPYSSSSGGTEKGKLEFDLPQGLYSLRISLPYISDSRLFPMPVVMDQYITVREGDAPQELSFLANLKFTKNQTI